MAERRRRISSERFVKQHYPNAQAHRVNELSVVLSLQPDGFEKQLGYGRTQRAAWRNAESNIQMEKV